MKRAENLNAPSLAGWFLAAAAGFLAFLVSKIIGGFDWTPSVFFGLVVMVVAGLVMGMPWGASVPAAADDGAGDGHGAAAATGAPVAAPVAAAVTAAASKPSAATAPVSAAAIKVAEAAPSAATAPVAVASAVPPAAPKAAKPAAKVADAAPAAAATAAGADGSKPAALSAPRAGKADDLKTIEGIGPALEKLCNEMGIFHFDQIASWGAAEVAWMDGNLKGFKGRVTRDKWVAQAKLIGSVGVEEFLRRAKTNDY